MLQLRVSAPAEFTDDVLHLLETCPGVSTINLFKGSAVRPSGDLVIADIARESADGIIRELDRMHIDDYGAITLLNVDTAISRAAEIAEEKAPGEGADAVIWEEVVRRTDADATLSWAFVAFLTLATILAGIAVITDSAILVIGAMVVGPEFGPVSGIAVGLVARRRGLLRRALITLAVGFAVSIVITALLALIAAALGWIDDGTLTGDRPLTGFIWKPDIWSFIVAFIAGIAGTLSMTSARSTALTGVFISVTTVPAAGNFALALALRDPNEMGGSAAQLGVNLAAILVAGVITLGLLRLAVRPKV